jgi:hypothetical protein
MANQWENQSVRFTYQLTYQTDGIRDENAFDAMAEPFLLQNLKHLGSDGWEIVHIESDKPVQITATRIEYEWEVSCKRRTPQSVGEGSRMAYLWEYTSLSFAKPVNVFHRQQSEVPFPLAALDPDMDTLNQLGADGWELACAIPAWVASCPQTLQAPS